MKLRKGPPRLGGRYTNVYSPVHVKARDAILGVGPVRGPWRVVEGGGDGKGRKGRRERCDSRAKQNGKKEKGPSARRLTISTPQPVRNSGEEYLRGQQRNFEEGARELGFEGLGVMSISSARRDPVVADEEIVSKRDVRKLGGHLDGLKAHPVGGDFVPPSYWERPPTRRHSERKTSPKGKGVEFVDTTARPQTHSGAQGKRESRPRSTSQPIHDLPRANRVGSSVSQPRLNFQPLHDPLREDPIDPVSSYVSRPPAPPPQITSRSNNGGIPESIRMSQAQGIRPHHLIRPHSQHHAVAKVLRFSTAEPISVPPPPPSFSTNEHRDTVHGSLEANLEECSPGRSYKRDSIPGSLKANPLQKVYTPPNSPSPTTTLNTRPASSNG